MRLARLPRWTNSLPGAPRSYCLPHILLALQALFASGPSVAHENSYLSSLLAAKETSQARGARKWSWLEWSLQNQVSARKLELNKIIFRQTLRLLTTNDLCFLLKSLCKPRMDTVLQNVDQCSDPPRLVTFHVHSVSISEQWYYFSPCKRYS